ncbi:hypothetical protein COCON_G00149460 [Conger conger]|uniref:NAD(P)H oxidase (H2O2-forming) n=1 Tax=Conger conger TaxID=82655 RepID=A0A9Q1HUQ3_CONCO|nr:hypothetical protein COCON_G00149460 [Conger conger]
MDTGEHQQESVNPTTRYPNINLSQTNQVRRHHQNSIKPTTACPNISINPTTRYPNINLKSIKANQVLHLYDVEDDMDSSRHSRNQKAKIPRLRQDSVGGCEDLLCWCQQSTAGYKHVKVEDLTQSWRSGLALCALIHHFRPSLIDYSSLDEMDAAGNNQLAFDVAESELGIPPIMSGSDMAAQSQPDRLAMVLYLTQFYDAFSQRTPSAEPDLLLPASKPISFSGTQSVVCFLSKLKHNSLQRRKEKLASEKKDRGSLMRSEKKDNEKLAEDRGSLMRSEKKDDRVYVLERVSTEGKFFHRGCFTCHQCGSTLRLGSYGFSQLTGRFFCAQHSEEVDGPCSTQETPGGDSESALPQSKESQEHRPAPAWSETPEIIQTPDSPGASRHLEGSASPGHGSVAEPRECGDAEAAGMGRSTSNKFSPVGDTVPNELDDRDIESGGESCAFSPDHQGADSPRPVPAVRTSHLAVRVRVESYDDTPQVPERHPPVPQPRAARHETPNIVELVTPPGEEAQGDEKDPRGTIVLQNDGEEDPTYPRTPQVPERHPPVPQPRAARHETTNVVELVTPPGEEAHGDETDPRGTNVLQNDGEEDPTCPSTPQDSRPKQPLRKLQLTAEEKNQLLNLNFSHDSDPETPAALPSSSSPSSSSSASASAPPKPPRALQVADGMEEVGPWGVSPSGSVRDQSNRRSFRRKEEPGGQQASFLHRPRSKFSPWNLSSPRLGREHRFGGTAGPLEKPGLTAPLDGNLLDDAEDDEDDDDDDDEEEEVFSGDDVMDLFDEKFNTLPSDPVEAQKLELMKMRTLERRAKMCEMQRFHKAQSIQRRLEEIEVTFKELEDKGVQLERVLRGEAGKNLITCRSQGTFCSVPQNEPDHLQIPGNLPQSARGCRSEESELMVASRQLELEDKQSMLEMELRRYMEMDDSVKSSAQRAEEERVLQEMLEVVDMRNSLVAFLEEKRLKEINEQLHCVSVLEPKRPHTAGAQVHWA